MVDGKRLGIILAHAADLLPPDESRDLTAAMQGYLWRRALMAETGLEEQHQENIRRYWAKVAAATAERGA